MRIPVFLLLAAFVLPGCRGVHPRPVAPAPDVVAPTQFDHALFDAVLQMYVDERGMVDYAALKQHGALTPYLEQLAGTDPSALQEKDRLAFWINAYNANTLRLIVDHYPTKRIIDLVPFAPFGIRVFVPKANSPFSVPFIRVGERILSLDDIEHGILRSEFDEPRIHFALVCAAVSCPPLRREAYVGARIDEQLQDQGHRFLRDTTKNQVPSAPGHIRLSKIFDWFRGDFGLDEAALQRYLARFFGGDIRRQLDAAAYRITYNTYDWRLNDQATNSP